MFFFTWKIKENFNRTCYFDLKTRNRIVTSSTLVHSVREFKRSTKTIPVHEGFPQKTPETPHRKKTRQHNHPIQGGVAKFPSTNLLVPSLENCTNIEQQSSLAVFVGPATSLLGISYTFLSNQQFSQFLKQLGAFGSSPERRRKCFKCVPSRLFPPRECFCCFFFWDGLVTAE